MVYQDNSAAGGSDGWDVYLWLPGREPEQITESGGDHINPATDGKTVVWQDDRNGNWGIYAYSLDTGKESAICKAKGEQTEPRIGAGGSIVWVDDRSGNEDIYLCENYGS